MGKNVELSEEIVYDIKAFIEKKQTDDNLQDKFPNKVLRDDVLEILDLYCTVVYYPFENDHNNGFHITGIPNRNGGEEHFVFINTAPSVEKQVFTAAHELGHVWEVDKTIAKKHRAEYDADTCESIINRFAAELLMPEAQFIKIANDEFLKYKDGSTSLTILNLLKSVASLMNYFLAPEKAVIRRLGEIGALDKSTVQMLTEEDSSIGNISVRKIVSETISEIVKSNGYTDLQKGSQKKTIKDLQDLLEEAEAKQSVAQSKIDSLRAIFDISEPKNSKELDEKIDVFSIKGS